MVKLNKASRKYIKEVGRVLPCRRGQKRKIIQEIQSSIVMYLAENPDADYDVISLRFGKPEQIAASLVEDMGADELLKRLNLKKKILLCVLCAIIAILAIWLGVVSATYVKYLDQSNGYYDIAIDVIEDIQFTEGE